MGRYLALDLETTGLDTATARITEIGAALYDTERRTVLQLVSCLIELPVGVELTAKVKELTGIWAQDLDEFGRPLPAVLLELGRLCREHGVERLVGHNGRAYDREVLRHEIGRLVAAPIEITGLLGISWLDTLEDLPLPETVTSRRLGHLAADHGFLNPFSHRALHDALTSLRLLTCYPLDVVLARADSPVTAVQAVCSFEEKDKAKELGFQWEPATKRWLKNVKELDADLLRQRAAEIRLTLRKVAA